MKINIKDYLTDFMISEGISSNEVQLPDRTVQTDHIRVIMINEAPPQNPDDYFYSSAESPDDMKTTRSLFQNAGVRIRNIEDILNVGIYITTAVKSAKMQDAVDAEKIREHLPVLEKEIGLFPNLTVIMLMGDVAKKAFNIIAKKNTGKNAVPASSTYKIRENEYDYGGIRIFPSYIMTGRNILIEKSKRDMVSDDISRMMEIISH